MTAYSLDYLRQPLLDAAREAHNARTCNKVVMSRALCRAEAVLHTAADRLWQAATLAGIDIDGDLILADKLAAAQRDWNAGRHMDALDRLLEAVGHMSNVINDTRAGAA